jgi:peptidoglycan/xylan/chitin deacetylase (PgdA/CDA1 family)
MGKSILEIHEWKPEFENLPLENYILTFDDGLYSQYKAKDFLASLNTPKIFFISTDIIRPKYQEPSDEIIFCATAHKKAFSENNKENYMNWSEIEELSQLNNFEIGGHSHYHRLYSYSPLKDLYANLIDDTERMLNNFRNNKIKITKFCFPYNENYNSLYNGILIKQELLDFYGKERIPIEKLQEEQRN